MPDSEIRRRRLALGHDQETIARLAGVHRMTLSRIENGRVSARMDVRRRLCFTLSIPWAMHRIVFGPFRAGCRRPASSASRETIE
jgi:transcriptional regulator with XRE-family HTH domain